MTPKQQLFVNEYLIDLNATQAAIRCGYSAKTAEAQGSRLLRNVKIAAAVEKAMAQRAERTEITADRVLQELAKIGFSDVRKIFTAGGALLNPVDMDDEMAAAVQSVEVITRRKPGDEKEVEEVHKIKLNDKLGALTQIGRHLGMFTDKSEVKHSGGLALSVDPDDAGA
jgi:phage terminase small subunit